jgi:V8-like Glu-specific endopeptidase
MKNRKTHAYAAVRMAAVVAILTAVRVYAQAVREETFDEPAWLDSGRIDNPTTREREVSLGVVTVERGPWMRVHVGDYDLGRASYLTFTALDDHVQRHDSRSLPDWQNWSAMFNGTEVQVAIHVAPGDFGVFAQIDQVRAPVLAPAPPADGGVAGTGICNDFDDRGASSDSRVGRIAGCTGWLVSNGAVLTAGHCLSIGPGTVMEFNVPPSLPNGVTVMAAPNDQYPVNPATMRSENGGQGADWMVLGLNPNANGRRAQAVQGFFFMTSLGPAIDTTLRVTGYGLDNTPTGPGGSFCLGGPNQGNPCTSDANCPPGNAGQCSSPAGCDPDGSGSDFSNQFNCSAASRTQQTTTGRLDDLDEDIIEFDVDIMPGNSGGPIIWENSDGYTIGIATHDGCNDFFSGYNNHGTRLHRGALEAALQNFLGPNTLYVDWADVGLPATGRIYEPLHSVSQAVAAVADGGIIAMVPGSYPRAAGNTFIAGADGKAMTFVAPVGGAVIGN